MKIKINGQEKQVPSKWSDVTFKMFLDLAGAGDDNAKKLAAFTGLPEKDLRTATLVNVDVIIHLLSFTETTELSQQVPDTILGYVVPNNLETQTIGQFEDLKLIANEIAKEAKDKGQVGVENLKKFTEIVGIYTQPNYHESTDEEKTKWAAQFMDAPCEEVMAIGNFTLLKLNGLKMGIGNLYQKVNTPISRFKLVLTSYLKRLAFTVRFYLWKRKLRSIETSY